MPNKTQLTIDFSRGEQLAMLRNARLPDGRGKDGGRVSAAAQKAILRAIDDYGGGREAWPNQTTIAADTGFGRRTVQRAIESLEAGSLLIRQRRRNARGGSGNFYRIVWSELALLTQPKPPQPDEKPAAKPSADQCAMATDQCAMVTDQCAMVAPAIGSAQEAQRNATPQPPAVPIGLALPSVPAAGRSAVDQMQSADDNQANDKRPDSPPHWGDAAIACRDAGLLAAGAAVKTAKAAGWTPAQLIDAARTYQANTDRLRHPRSILFRIENGTWPVEGIRTAAERQAAVRDAEQRAAAARAAEQQRRAAIQRERAESARRVAQLERDHGPRLDRLPPDALRDLAARILATDFELQRFMRDPRAPTPQRAALLAALSDNALVLPHLRS